VSDENKYIAGIESDQRKAPVRVAFVTRRTSPHVKAAEEPLTMTHPGAFLRFAVAVEVLVFALVWMALLVNAPLEQIANPQVTPNPAKAPWYFLGLQELLHYFPPVVAGVLIPTLVILALIIIPYFNVNIEGKPMWQENRQVKLQIFWPVFAGFTIFLLVFDVYPAVVPTLLIGSLMALAAYSSPDSKRPWLWRKPLSFWIMTWFLLEFVLLTLIGTFFRGPGWSYVLPWKS
jgi:menaquinol-cytochrome c reductase cytochrome b/c subunit